MRPPTATTLDCAGAARGEYEVDLGFEISDIVIEGDEDRFSEDHRDDLEWELGRHLDVMDGRP